METWFYRAFTNETIYRRLLDVWWKYNFVNVRLKAHEEFWSKSYSKHCYYYLLVESMGQQPVSTTAASPLLSTPVSASPSSTIEEDAIFTSVSMNAMEETSAGYTDSTTTITTTSNSTTTTNNTTTAPYNAITTTTTVEIILPKNALPCYILPNWLNLIFDEIVYRNDSPTYIVYRCKTDFEFDEGYQRRSSRCVNGYWSSRIHECRRK